MGAVRLVLTGRGRLSVAELDPDSAASKQLALIVRQQVLGSGRIDQGALRGAVGPVKEIVLVAEEDNRLGFPVDGMIRLLGEFAADPSRLTDAGWHSVAASLLKPESVCDPGLVSTGKEEQARVIALRRKAVGLGRGEEQQAARAEGQGPGAEEAWSGQLRVPDLPARIVAPLGEIAGALEEISELTVPDVSRLRRLLDRIGGALSEVVRPLYGAAAQDEGTSMKLVEVRMAGDPASGPSHAEVEPAANQGRGRATPLPCEGHPVIESLAGLWDQRKSLPPARFAHRFQVILDQFHRQGTLGSFELNDAAVRWINQLAAKNDVKLMLNGEIAVRLRCAKRGDGYFQPRRAKRGGRPVPKAGSKQFPLLRAIPV
jgi:hypothetical protein